MPNIMAPPYPYQTRELQDPSTGRVWPLKVVDRLVVGYLHGLNDWIEIWLHLGIAYPNFADVTNDEIVRLWNEILPRTKISFWWSLKNRDDPEVKMVLDDIKPALDRAKEFLAPFQRTARFTSFQSSWIYDPTTGRIWPPEVVNRLIVGHVHGDCDWTDTWRHLGIAYHTFNHLTNQELEDLWNDVLLNTNVLNRWLSKGPEDPEVKQVLKDIKPAMDVAQAMLRRVPSPSG